MACRFPQQAQLLVLLAASSLVACTRPVAVDGRWSEGVPRSQSFSRVLVVGISPDVNQRCAFEQAMAAALRSATVTATMSCSAMTTAVPLTRENVERAVATLGADAVLATRLVTSSAKVKEGGSADARGGGYYKATGTGYEYGYGYWGAYGVPVVYAEFEVAPSVFSISGTVHILTMLYATSDASLVYTLDTKAKDLASRQMALAEITPEIAANLGKEGLVR
jgi:hypothetical protein